VSLSGHSTLLKIVQVKADQTVGKLLMCYPSQSKQIIDTYVSSTYCTGNPVLTLATPTATLRAKFNILLYTLPQSGTGTRLLVPGSIQRSWKFQRSILKSAKSLDWKKSATRPESDCSCTEISSMEYIQFYLLTIFARFVEILGTAILRVCC